MLRAMEQIGANIQLGLLHSRNPAPGPTSYWKFPVFLVKNNKFVRKIAKMPVLWEHFPECWVLLENFLSFYNKNCFSFLPKIAWVFFWKVSKKAWTLSLPLLFIRLVILGQTMTFADLINPIPQCFSVGYTICILKHFWQKNYGDKLMRGYNIKVWGLNCHSVK